MKDSKEMDSKNISIANFTSIRDMISRSSNPETKLMSSFPTIQVLQGFYSHYETLQSENFLMLTSKPYTKTTYELIG